MPRNSTGRFNLPKPSTSPWCLGQLQWCHSGQWKRSAKQKCFDINSLKEKRVFTSALVKILIFMVTYKNV